VSKELRDAEQLAADPLDELIARVEKRHDATLSRRIAGALAIKCDRGDVLTVRERDRLFYTLWTVALGRDARHAMGVRKKGRGRTAFLKGSELMWRAELVAFFWIKGKKLDRTGDNRDSAFHNAARVAGLSWQTMRDAWKVHGRELQTERDQRGKKLDARLERAYAGQLRD